MNMLGAITEEQRLQKGVVAVFGDKRYRASGGVLLIKAQDVQAPSYMGAAYAAGRAVG